MAVDAEQFADEAVESIVQIGNKLLGAHFKIEIEGCPYLSKLIITCTPWLPGRHPVENVPGQQGVEINEPGPKKTGGMFAMGFIDGVTGQAIKEYKEWEKNCASVSGRKEVRIYGHSEYGDSELDITYTHCWPDIEEGDFDAENKTAPARFNMNLHFANRMWTKAI